MVFMRKVVFFFKGGKGFLYVLRFPFALSLCLKIKWCLTERRKKKSNEERIKKIKFCTEKERNKMKWKRKEKDGKCENNKELRQKGQSRK